MASAGIPSSRGGLPPTTKHRRGRVTPRQARALAADSAFLLDPVDIPAALSAWSGPVVLDIGFGTGDVVESYARAEPDRLILAVDMHTPGIGDLLARVGDAGLANVIVVSADVRDILASSIPRARLCGVRSFFPDPWPKARHHRRRLIRGDFPGMVADAVEPGGFWHIATDWPDYADSLDEAMRASGRWAGERIPRPQTRPLTRYESRGLRAGREAIDSWWIRIRP